MPIFQDSNGLAIKFFLQKDISQAAQAELCETITALGGRVEAKVPRQGYILVQPGTPEEERLRLCWNSAERPERHIVPYTYVEACKIAGMLLKQIFVINGVPLKMHIHASIANINARATLSQRIMHSGGDPTASVQSTDVILADPNTEVFQHLVKTYQGAPNKYVESYLWVKKCVEKGSLAFTPLVYKNPGGRRPGEERTQFTEEDEQHLCDWIARKIPYKETGGRTGNRLYQQLCDLSNDPEYGWVSRHTWQSWRERYKKNAVRLDQMIAAIVEQRKPVPGEKGQYGYVRKAEEKPKRSRKKRAKAYEMDESHPDYLALDSKGESVPQITSQQMMYATPSVSPIPGFHVPGGGPLDVNLRKSPAEEEMDDADEDPEWMVRVGDAPTPSWGKRKADDETSETEAQKRFKAEHGPSQPTTSSQPDAPMWNIHFIDQTILDIAKEFRFTVEEVQEYYDSCGDMGLTKMRFQKMRQELSDRFADDGGPK